MHKGEILTRLTIWITIVGYLVGVFAFTLSRNRARWDASARLAWSVASLALVAHVACAYHFYHAWSQGAAYRETARQTAEVFRLNWGGGLYINYALLTFWILDVLWWWLRGLDSYRRRPWMLVAAWHGFLIFILFNATVVFKTGFVRWAGLFICLALCFMWWLAARDKSAHSTQRSGRFPTTIAQD